MSRQLALIRASQASVWCAQPTFIAVQHHLQMIVRQPSLPPSRTSPARTAMMSSSSSAEQSSPKLCSPATEVCPSNNCMLPKPNAARPGRLVVHLQHANSAHTNYCRPGGATPAAAQPCQPQHATTKRRLPPAQGRLYGQLPAASGVPSPAFCC
jgi:hypothetical protein